MFERLTVFLMVVSATGSSKLLCFVSPYYYKELQTCYYSKDVLKMTVTSFSKFQDIPRLTIQCFADRLEGTETDCFCFAGF